MLTLKELLTDLNHQPKIKMYYTLFPKKTYLMKKWETQNRLICINKNKNQNRV